MVKKRSQEFIVKPAEAGNRLDVYLAKQMAAQHSRAHLQKMIKNGAVLVNDQGTTPQDAHGLDESLAARGRQR